MSDFTRTPEGVNVLHLTTGEYHFTVYAHTGRDAARTRRLVQKINARRMASQASLLDAVRAKMSQGEQEKMDELQETMQALGESPKAKELEKELQELINKYQDQSMAVDAYARMMEGMDPDQEEILDGLAFKHTSVRCPATGGVIKKLSDAKVFDDVFMGSASELIDDVRQEIFQFNGFLGFTQATTSTAITPNSGN